MTVYESFIDLVSDLIEDCPLEKQKLVCDGIRSYLDKMGGADRTERAEQLARREWMRFRGISEKSFVAFFENYKLRSKIEQFKNECMILAIHRLKNEARITADEYDRRLSAFFELAAGIVTDSRYTPWLETITENVTGDLLFASGRTDRVRHEIVEQSLLWEKNQ